MKKIIDKKLFLYVLLIFTTACGQETKKEPQQEIKQIRKAAVAGSFYPISPGDLSETINGYLNQANPQKIEDEIIGIVSPHAGYVFSGPVAAFAYKLLRGSTYDVVVVISPSHQEYFKGCSVYNGDAYETPLGKVPVNKELVIAITSKNENIYSSEHGHFPLPGKMGEHSLEVQIPFLQSVLGNFSIVPIVMGDQSEQNCLDLGEILANVLKGKKFLIVASSDLSHYHPYTDAHKIDANAVKAFESGDYKKILQCDACGAGPIAAMMIATKKSGANQTKILKYATSGDVPEGEKGRVVGYMSGVSIKTKEKNDSLEVGFNLTDEEKKELLALAKQTIVKCVSGESLGEYTPKHDILKTNCGAFVTIHKKGDLRGCIGHIIGDQPLYKTVEEMAVAAAQQDPRFYPVQKDELPLLDIEISVLSPFERVRDLKEIEVGKHGLMISKGRYRGLLLPQVATENNWNKEEFLEYTCRKAGLSTNAYKDPETIIEKFSAIVFGEKDLK
jgi:hypothetical protein